MSMNVSEEAESSASRIKYARHIRNNGLDENFFLREMMTALGARKSLSRLKIVSVLFNRPDNAGVSIDGIINSLEEQGGVIFEKKNLYGSIQRIKECEIIQMTLNRTYIMTPEAVRKVCQLVDGFEPRSQSASPLARLGLKKGAGPLLSLSA